MSFARDDVLATIRRSLGVNGAEAPRRAEIEDRLSRAPDGIIPERARVSGAERLALFKTPSRGRARHDHAGPGRSFGSGRGGALSA